MFAKCRGVNDFHHNLNFGASFLKDDKIRARVEISNISQFALRFF